MKTGTKKKSEKQNSTEQRKTNFKTLRNFQISRVFKRTNFDSNRLHSPVRDYSALIGFRLIFCDK